MKKGLFPWILERASSKENQTRSTMEAITRETTLSLNNLNLAKMIRIKGKICNSRATKIDKSMKNNFRPQVKNLSLHKQVHQKVKNRLALSSKVVNKRKRQSLRLSRRQKPRRKLKNC